MEGIRRMNIEQLIEEIEVYVDNCKSAGVLCGGNTIKVNREELLAMLDELRTQLPGELSESRRIISTSDSILADARAKADRIVQDAAKEAGVLIDDNEIVALANMRADEIIRNANEQAESILSQAKETSKALQHGALEYTQSMMGGLEYLFDSMIDQEKKYFDSVIAKLKEDHKQIIEDKHEIDLQLGYGVKSTRSKEDFEKKNDTKE